MPNRCRVDFEIARNFFPPNLVVCGFGEVEFEAV